MNEHSEEGSFSVEGYQALRDCYGVMPALGFRPRQPHWAVEEMMIACCEEPGFAQGQQECHHRPVLRNEVVKCLAPQADEVMVDGTFGRGGHSQAILDAASCRVIGIDCDPDAIGWGRRLARQYAGRLTILPGNFSQMAQLVPGPVDMVLLDLGVSSPQLDEAARGFSFQKEGPLDMRMSGDGPTAADLVNTLPHAHLADIFRVYGEERHAGRVATAICRVRLTQKITKTSQLAEIVRKNVPKKQMRIDPATRCFQALRIAVNDELRNLAQALLAAESMLRPGGRLAVISFHSLEDRMAKRFFASRAQEKAGYSRHDPAAQKAEQIAQPKAVFDRRWRKPIMPSLAEKNDNPRARSAIMRVATRLDGVSIGVLPEMDRWGRAI